MDKLSILDIIDDLSEEEILLFQKGLLKFADDVDPEYLYEDEDELEKMKAKHLSGN